MEGQGSVSVTEKGTPVLRTDGPCLEGTLGSIGAGPEAMPPAALAKIKSDSLALLARVVSVYESTIAQGEVGATGSGVASKSAPTQPSTGLLYGRIQSGKTVAMIALVAAAIDNGFRVVVVLTSDNVKLVSQTTGRFAVLEGPITLDARQPDEWSGDEKHIGKNIGKAGLVIICSKNSTRLEDLVEFLNKIGAPGYPALILDDEADQGTLDTNLARSKKDSSVDPTAIYTRVVNELRATLPHHVFLQVTATPYALLLQSVGTQLRPSFTHLLEPGEDYTGGECFFEKEHLEGPSPPLVFVPKDESQAIFDGLEDAPEGLRAALAFFLVAAGAQMLSDPQTAKSGQYFLCHTSQLRDQHSNLETMVRDYLDRISGAIESGKGEPLDRLHLAYDELRKTVPTAPLLAKLLDQIRIRLVNRKIIVVNAKQGKAPSLEASKGLNFLIGGNIIGRGVTIKNLLVTYYLREPKTGQMDTTLQHARMYGYRSKIMPLTRVFLPQQLALRFHEIHNIERRLRRHLVTADMGRPIVIERASKLIPTRRAVLDTTYIDAFDATDQVFPTHPDLHMKPKEYEVIHGRIRALVGGELTVEPQLELIEFEELLSLVEDLPFNDKEESSSWIPAVLVRVLERQKERCKGRAYIYTRKMSRTITHFVGGALNSEELAKIRKQDGPVICAFRDDGTHIKDEHASPYWYPTLVFDEGMPSLVINVTPDGE